MCFLSLPIFADVLPRYPETMFPGPCRFFHRADVCNTGLYYDGSHEYRLYGYTDADWAGSISDRKSTSGGCYSLRSAMISWFSRKQSSVALSTAKAEYIAACSASCEAIWLQNLMLGLFNLELDTTMILCDNQSCIKMTKNPVFHYRSKHIEIRYFYIRDRCR